MEKRIIIGLLAIFALVVILIRFGLSGMVKLDDYVTQVAVGLTLLIFGVGFWTFKPQLTRWLVPASDRKPITSPTTTSTVVLASRGSDRGDIRSAYKLIGSPTNFENHIQHYGRRSQIPLDLLFAEAQEKIEMLAVTFHDITTNNIKLVEKTIYRNVKITFLILRPDSRYATQRQNDFHEGEEVQHHIERSLLNLCGLKSRLKSEFANNLIIKTYDALIDKSIIIIDDKLIKIETHVKGSDPNTRPNQLAFKADNEPFFTQYSYELSKISVENYNC